MKGKSVKACQFNHQMDVISSELNEIINKLIYKNDLNLERIKEVYKETVKKTTTFLPLEYLNHFLTQKDFKEMFEE